MSKNDFVKVAILVRNSNSCNSTNFGKVSGKSFLLSPYFLKLLWRLLSFSFIEIRTRLFEFLWVFSGILKIASSHNICVTASKFSLK